MSAKILSFHMRRLNREAALRWLSDNVEEFPSADSLQDRIDGPYFGWIFVRALDGVVYFANCLDPGITEDEMNAYRDKLTEISTN